MGGGGERRVEPGGARFEGIAVGNAVVVRVDIEVVGRTVIVGINRAIALDQVGHSVAVRVAGGDLCGRLEDDGHQLLIAVPLNAVGDRRRTVGDERNRVVQFVIQACTDDGAAEGVAL